MWSISVEPRPSRTGAPKRSSKARPISAGERLAGRDRQTQRGRGVLAPVGGVREQRAVERRHAVENGRPVLAQQGPSRHPGWDAPRALPWSPRRGRERSSRCRARRRRRAWRRSRRGRPRGFRGSPPRSAPRSRSGGDAGAWIPWGSRWSPRCRARTRRRRRWSARPRASRTPPRAGLPGAGARARLRPPPPPLQDGVAPRGRARIDRAAARSPPRSVPGSRAGGTRSRSG